MKARFSVKLYFINIKLCFYKYIKLYTVAVFLNIWPTEHSKYVSRNLRCAWHLLCLSSFACTPRRFVPEESTFLHSEIHLGAESCWLPKGINLKVRDLRWEQGANHRLSTSFPSYGATETGMSEEMCRIYYDEEPEFWNYQDWKLETPHALGNDEQECSKWKWCRQQGSWASGQMEEAVARPEGRRKGCIEILPHPGRNSLWTLLNSVKRRKRS